MRCIRVGSTTGAAGGRVALANKAEKLCGALVGGAGTAKGTVLFSGGGATEFDVAGGGGLLAVGELAILGVGKGSRKKLTPKGI